MLESAAQAARKVLEKLQEKMVSGAATLSEAVVAIDQRIAELDGSFRAGEELIQREVASLIDQLRKREEVLNGRVCILFTKRRRRRCGSREKDWTACGPHWRAD
jgi:chaperonin cofactor prefoldin